MNGFKKCSGVLALVLIACAVTPRLSAEEQRHMTAALDRLEGAKVELEAADHDKGGHRAKALRLTQEAIEEVRAGINSDNKHSQKQTPHAKPVASGQANGK
jgi:hypothetical protein